MSVDPGGRMAVEAFVWINLDAPLIADINWTRPLISVNCCLISVNFSF